MDKLVELSQKLNKSSIKNFNNPYTSIQWIDELPSDYLYFSPEMISIYHLNEFKSLSDTTIRKLGLYEAVNFFGINIHGEKDLIQGLSKRLYQHESSEITNYIHHFIDEENKHMLWFGTFCEKYAGKVYQNNKVHFPREYEEGEEEFLFFSKVVIFEELVDHYNFAQSKDERLHPLVRQIHKQHHIDESRHLIFGREMSKSLFEKYSQSTWSEQKVQCIGKYLANYITSTWKEYYNPEVYIDAGLDNPYDLFEKAWENEKTREHRYKVSEKVINFFTELGLMKEGPIL